ncbi:hypothetical protein T492DRAFT_1003123 [Pavlovales sp. CCMP2436]|nr:hypothetical protein T492DRAFT_1003123 [Pavlovales sp. CCMP2436]
MPASLRSAINLSTEQLKRRKRPISCCAEATPLLKSFCAPTAPMPGTRPGRSGSAESGSLPKRRITCERNWVGVVLRSAR